MCLYISYKMPTIKKLQLSSAPVGVPVRNDAIHPLHLEFSAVGVFLNFDP